MPREGQREALKKYTHRLTERAKSGKLVRSSAAMKRFAGVIQVPPAPHQEQSRADRRTRRGQDRDIEGSRNASSTTKCPRAGGKRVLSLDMACSSPAPSIARVRGAPQERIEGAGAGRRPDHRLHRRAATPWSRGQGEGSWMPAICSSPRFARGELHCVGATTLDEYRKYIEKDAALSSARFQKVLVDEPSVETPIAILRGLQEKYEVPPTRSTHRPGDRAAAGAFAP